MFTKINKIICIVGALTIAWAGLVYAQELPDAKEFENQCWQDGAVNYINEITHGTDLPVWGELLDKIASGDEDWIRASACIAQNSDYSSQSMKIDIYISWALALPKNPQAVLGLAAFSIPLRQMCSFRIIEPEREWAAQYVKDTLAALETIPDDAQIWDIPLDIERQVCALRLKDAYEKNMIMPIENKASLLEQLGS